MADPERPTDDRDEGRERLRREMRQAFIEEAEEDTRRHLGRSLTDEELRRVLRRYPGDVEQLRDQRL